MRVEVDDFLDHTCEHLAAGLAGVGAHVQPPDPQGAVVLIQKLGPYFAGEEARCPLPLVAGPLDRVDRFVVNQQPALAIHRTDEGDRLEFGEPAVQGGRIQFAEPVFAASS